MCRGLVSSNDGADDPGKGTMDDVLSHAISRARPISRLSHHVPVCSLAAKVGFLCSIEKNNLWKATNLLCFIIEAYLRA
jgi:hypothetical protein